MRDPVRTPARVIRTRRLILLLLVLLGAPAPGRADDPLPCGAPIAQTLSGPGEVQSYAVRTVPGSVVLIQSSIRSATLGPLRMQLRGPRGESIVPATCTGIIQFAGRSEDLTLDVSACNGSSTGNYTVELNVISDGAANCGQLVACGASPTGTGFRIPGAVDSFQLPLTAGEPATLKVNYLQRLRQNEPAAPYVKVFDPAGRDVVPGVCVKSIALNPTQSGIYTAVVSSCGVPEQRAYRIELLQPSCPSGPTITHFGITRADGEPVDPLPVGDEAGRPVFNPTFGQNFSLVIEARAGASGRRAGEWTVPYQSGVTIDDPDLQVIVSRPLGNGDPAICDVVPPNLGGVAATVPFAFADDDAARARVADLGCRFDNGRGAPVGRRDNTEACTRTNQGFGFSFVDSGSSIQYCAQIATPWGFPDGETIVAARVKDSLGNFGAVREIVIRVGAPLLATATITRMPTPTITPSLAPSATITRAPTATSTPPVIRTATVTVPPGSTATATPTRPICPGDCNRDHVVLVNEVTRMVNIAFETVPVTECPAGDVDGDGRIVVPEMLQAVGTLLNGCP